MRISDWSSDVCSSDLPFSGQTLPQNARGPQMALTDATTRNAKPREKPYKVSDAKGLYLQINPFDARCAYWSPFAEIAHPADADRIAQQLIPETGDKDNDVWLETSRILVANIDRKTTRLNSSH